MSIRTACMHGAPAVAAVRAWATMAEAADLLLKGLPNLRCLPQAPPGWRHRNTQLHRNTKREQTAEQKTRNTTGSRETRGEEHALSVLW